MSLGSDINGSLRVPASLCGVFSLKPSYGRLSHAGSFSFVDSLDRLGPMARSVTDLAMAYDAMQGPVPDDQGCADRPADHARPGPERGVAGLRFAGAGGLAKRSGGASGRPRGSCRRPGARRGGGAGNWATSLSAGPRPGAPPPVSSPIPKAPPSISRGCTTARRSSTPTRTTVSLRSPTSRNALRDDGHSTAFVSSMSPGGQAEPGRDRPPRTHRD
ncbi:MAG: amidase family protein [Salipiger thiooxidans]|uniref:amidase family protein n=1 Tax=Salipiger thiooxidans TaxID=282683 RepID=UPI0038508316